MVHKGVNLAPCVCYITKESNSWLKSGTSVTASLYGIFEDLCVNIQYTLT